MSARTLRPTVWLDAAAAAIPAGSAIWSASVLAPLFDVAPMLAAGAAGLVVFASGLALMKLAAPREAPFEIRAFRASELDGELLLDQPLADPVAALAELLLDDPLPVVAPDSRVVQLFPRQPPPSPEELKRRVDRHLGQRSTGGGAAQGAGDAGDALRLALEDLRRSLSGRQVTQ